MPDVDNIDHSKGIDRDGFATVHLESENNSHVNLYGSVYGGCSTYLTNMDGEINTINSDSENIPIGTHRYIINMTDINTLITKPN